MAKTAVTGSVPAVAAGQSKRDWRIDFWRGLAILFIFWNHSVENIFSWFTTKYYGVSDSAELFVFLSGFAMASMFLAKFLSRPAMAVPYSIGRAFTLYLHHITAVVIVVSLAVYYRDVAGSSAMEHALFLRPILISTETVLPKLATLGYLPPLLDILPLYIVLTLLVGVLFWAFRDRWPYYAAFAVVVWSYVFVTKTALSSFPDTRVWSFNPLAWQMVFLAGFVACLVRHEAWLDRVIKAPATLALSITVLIIGFVAAAPWATWGLVEWRPLDIIPQVAGKANASPIRLVHFLALAHIAVLVVRSDNPLPNTFLGRAVILVGRRSLPLFVLSTIFATISYGAFDWFGRSYPMQVVYILAGTVILLAIAMIAEELGKVRSGRPPAKVAPAPQPAATEGVAVRPATAPARHESR